MFCFRYLKLSTVDKVFGFSRGFSLQAQQYENENENETF